VNQIGLAVVFLLEAVAAFYVVAVTWLLSSWFVDDSVAFRLSPRDWWIEAAYRSAVAIALALVSGVIIWLINRWIFQSVNRPSSKLPIWSGLLVAFAVGIAGVGGAVRFLIEKPFM
jgi:Zn-dependent protease with chaperone function